MKLKKGLIIAIISILILTFSTNSFAMSIRSKSKSKSGISNSVKNEVDNTVENKTENEVKSSNEISNKIKNEVNNETENKVKSSNEIANKTKNEVSNETNNKSEIENYFSKNETETKNESINEKSGNTKKEIVNKDISIIEPSDELEYENLKINGNIFIISSNKVTFNNLEVDGNVMLFTSEEAKILNSEINGSVYVASENVVIKDSTILSLYSAGNDLNIEEGTEIDRELKLIGSKITFGGEVGRDFCAIGERVKIADTGKVAGKTVIKSEERIISKSADIQDVDYEEISYMKDSYEDDVEDNISSYLIDKGIEIAVILVIAVFLLCGFPKITNVNSKVRLSRFFVDFLLGILIFIISLAIAVGLFVTGYGFGYGLILLNIVFLLIILGKIMFIISFAIRFTCNSEKASKVKVFFGIILVTLVLDLIGMISFAGNVGMIISSVISVILAFTGFGATFGVIFASRKKYENKIDGGTKNKQEPIIEKSEKVTPEEKADKKNDKESLKKEIKEEVKQEIEELKEERKLEKEVVEENKKEEKKDNDEDNKENIDE